MRTRGPWRDTRGATTVEFAVTGWLLCMLTFAVVEAGLLWWLKSGLQVAASMTARCGAIGYNQNFATTACPKGASATIQAYAVSTANTFVLPGALTAANVTLNGASGFVSSCNGQTGNYFSVTVSSGFFTFLPPPLGNQTVSGTACYPL